MRRVRPHEHIEDIHCDRRACRELIRPGAKVYKLVPSYIMWDRYAPQHYYEYCSYYCAIIERNALIRVESQGTR
jgi:hypothetical protein